KRAPRQRRRRRHLGPHPDGQLRRHGGPDDLRRVPAGTAREGRAGCPGLRDRAGAHPRETGWARCRRASARRLGRAVRRGRAAGHDRTAGAPRDGRPGDVPRRVRGVLGIPARPGHRLQRAEPGLWRRRALHDDRSAGGDRLAEPQRGRAELPGDPGRLLPDLPRRDAAVRTCREPAAARLARRLRPRHRGGRGRRRRGARRARRPRRAAGGRRDRLPQRRGGREPARPVHESLASRAGRGADLRGDARQQGSPVRGQGGRPRPLFPPAVTAGPRGGALSRFLAADGFFLSAGLAFFFLVSLIPILLLGVSLVGFVLSGEDAARQVVAQLAEQFPVYQKQIARALLGIVETRGTSGILGVVALMFFSTPLLSAARLVLHRLLAVRSESGVLRNLIRDGAMALVLSTLLFIVSTVTWLYQWFRALAVNALPVPPGFGLAGLPLSLALSTTMFFLAYRYLPRRRVGIGP